MAKGHRALTEEGDGVRRAVRFSMKGAALGVAHFR